MQEMLELVLSSALIYNTMLGAQLTRRHSNLALTAPWLIEIGGSGLKRSIYDTSLQKDTIFMYTR